MSKTTEQRFWEKVDTSGDCWIWLSGRDKYGYGRFYTGGKGSRLAHRFSYQLRHGIELDPDTKVLHRCDNPPCVNPDHLFTGTQADNIIDMHAKVRMHSQRPAGLSILKPASQRSRLIMVCCSRIWLSRESSVVVGCVCIVGYLQYPRCRPAACSSALPVFFAEDPQLDSGWLD